MTPTQATLTENGRPGSLQERPSAQAGPLT